MRPIWDRLDYRNMHKGGLSMAKGRAFLFELELSCQNVGHL